MRILVCGGRYNADALTVARYLDPYRTQAPLVIQGGANGADYLAKQWAVRSGVHYAEVPALWDTHGRKAGPLRNQAMLALKPDVCIAFPGGRGTDNMISLCVQHNTPVVGVPV